LPDGFKYHYFASWVEMHLYLLIFFLFRWNLNCLSVR
jgi:hypothetical protein